MKKIVICLLSFLFISCNFGYKYSSTFKNDSSYDVQLELNEEIYDLKRGDSITIDFKYSDSKKVIDNTRVDIDLLYRDFYTVFDKSYDTITVYNASTHDIILYEKNDYIGTYEDITLAKENNRKFSVVVPADQTTSFKLYTSNPQYEAYFVHNNMPADISLLSFTK